VAPDKMLPQLQIYGMTNGFVQLRGVVVVHSPEKMLRAPVRAANVIWPPIFSKWSLRTS